MASTQYKLPNYSHSLSQPALLSHKFSCSGLIKSLSAKGDFVGDFVGEVHKIFRGLQPDSLPYNRVLPAFICKTTP